jgi:hypothetical protein
VIKQEEVDKKQDNSASEVEEAKKVFKKATRTDKAIQTGRKGLPSFFGL